MSVTTFLPHTSIPLLLMMSQFLHLKISPPAHQTLICMKKPHKELIITPSQPPPQSSPPQETQRIQTDSNSTPPLLSHLPILLYSTLVSPYMYLHICTVEMAHTRI